MNIASIATVFVAGGFAGWILDTADRTIEDRHWSPGGFSRIPFCPSYGFGVLLLVWIAPGMAERSLLERFLFLGALLTALEYVAALFSESVFGKRFWDYSRQAFNFHGRVDMKHFILWGILGSAALEWVVPALQHLP